MRYQSPAVAARRAARKSTHAASLIWLGGRDLQSGLIDFMGLWTGADHREFQIRGQVRKYYGAGNVLDVPPVQSTVGLEVRSYTLSVAFASPEVELLLRGYDPRLCPAEIHRVEFDEDGNLLGDPERLFKGWINGAPTVTPAIGGSATASVEVVSNARMLTRFGSATKSDQQQRQRQGDRFRRYASLSESATIYWGEKKIEPSKRAARGDQ